MAGKRLSRILFVINPISGDIEKDSVVTEIENFCSAEAMEPVFFETSGANDLEDLKNILKSTPFDAVVAVGGDGTVHLAGNAVIHSEIPLGILPMGSGNGLSKDTGIPQALPEALQVFTNYTIREIDTLSVNNKVCVHLTDFGFNALVVKLFNEGDKRGATSYAFVAMQEYLSYEPQQYRIETDNGSFSGPAFMVTATNASAFGSNATINPSGVIDDGKFEICIIEPFPKTSALQILYRLYNDSIEASDYSQLISCREAVIYNPENGVSHIDGEPFDLGKKINMRVLPKSLKLLLPNPPEKDEENAT